MSDVHLFLSGEKKAKECRCNFDRKEENHWVSVERWYGVPDPCGGNVNKTAKKKHIDQDMLSRKMNLQRGVPTPEPLGEA